MQRRYLVEEQIKGIEDLGTALKSLPNVVITVTEDENGRRRLSTRQVSIRILAMIDSSISTFMQ
jgi:hypothetical protein